MSWRYTSNKSKYYFSEKEIDFTADYLNYEQFLLQEFFTADLETAEKLSDYYYNVYGARSLAYAKRNTSGWINGDYHLTDLMRERITSIMPKFLNEKAKHKLGIYEFMTSIKNTVRSFQNSQKSTFKNTTNLIKPQEVIAIFEKEYEKIQALTIRNFRFNILTQEEKSEALEISKYILELKLQKTFDQIDRDFNVFIPYMYKFNRGVFSANYSITEFNLKLDITNTGLDDIQITNFRINIIHSNNRFKEYSDRYLAYELLSLHNEANKAVSNSFLNTNDIQLFLTHYEELFTSESELTLYSTFQGEGGVLSLRAELKPLNLLKKSILISALKIIIYLITVVSLVSLAINYEIFNLLIFGGLFLAFFALSLINQEVTLLKTLTKEYKTYGK